jgi:hypothetical protein
VDVTTIEVIKMSAEDEVDELIEQFHLAQGEFVKGNPEPVKKLLSHREDVTLNNPFSPPARGWEQVVATIKRAASPFRDGEFINAEIIEKHNSRVCLRSGDRAGRGQDRRKGGDHPVGSQGYDDL